jgi:hypothetical protein
MRLPTATFAKVLNQQFRGPVSRNINRSFYATMRAARYYGIKDIRVEQVPEPSVQPGQVKVSMNCYAAPMGMLINIGCSEICWHLRHR